MEKIIVFGNGDIARIISQYLQSSFDIVAYTVDREFVDNEKFEDKPLVPFDQISLRFPPDSHRMLTAVGYHSINSVRENAFHRAKSLGYKFVNYISNAASIVGNTQIGENNIILDNVSIQPGVVIGNGNVVWSNATIAHGCRMGDFNWVTSGTVIAGDVVVGCKNFFGVNSSIAHGKKIANQCIIAANTFLNACLEDGQVILSEPGEIIKLNSEKFLKFSGDL